MKRRLAVAAALFAVFAGVMHVAGQAPPPLPAPEPAPAVYPLDAALADARIIDGVNGLDLKDLQRPPAPEPRTGR